MKLALGLVGDNPRDQRLSGAGRAVKQDALTGVCPTFSNDSGSFRIRTISCITVSFIFDKPRCLSIRGSWHFDGKFTKGRRLYPGQALSKSCPVILTSAAPARAPFRIRSYGVRACQRLKRGFPAQHHQIGADEAVGPFGDFVQTDILAICACALSVFQYVQPALFCRVRRYGSRINRPGLRRPDRARRAYWSSRRR